MIRIAIEFLAIGAFFAVTITYGIIFIILLS
jgi:hypothetical protein